MVGLIKKETDGALPQFRRVPGSGWSGHWLHPRVQWGRAHSSWVNERLRWSASRARRDTGEWSPPRSTYADYR